MQIHIFENILRETDGVEKYYIYIILYVYFALQNFLQMHENP